MTNFEWLKSMDARGFAHYLAHSACDCCVQEDSDMCGGQCGENIAAWLDSEHEEPDSLERIREDARKPTCLYWGDHTFGCDECSHVFGECIKDEMLDLIERTVKVMEERR